MKKLWWSAILAMAVGVGCPAAWNAGSASAETLSIQGSSGFSSEVMGPYQAKIEAMTGHKLNVTATTSGEGLLAVLKGQADLAMISASLEAMVVVLQEMHPDLPFHLLRSFRVAEARVAYPVNPDNPVRHVSPAQIRQILSGQIENWRELGGPDLPIHVVSLREGGGTKRTTEVTFLNGQRITPRSEILADSAEDVIKTVMEDRGALGITQARLVKLHRLPELRTKALIGRWHSLVSLNEPTDAMREIVAAARRVAFEDEP